MDYYLEHQVRQQDGTEVGHLRHIIYDPETDQVVALVMQELAPDGHAVIIPVGAVDYRDSEDNEALYVLLDDQQVASLERFAYARNIAPPPYPGPGSNEPETDAFPAVPQEPPVGAATGITSIAYTPVIEVFANIPLGDIVLDRTTEVQATDGSIGSLVRLRTDQQTHRVTSFFAEHGLIFTHEVEVPIQWVASISHDAITVKVNKQQVEEANRE